MKTIYKVQVWHGRKYKTVHEGTSLDRAVIMSHKPYYINYYSSIRIIKSTEEVISRHKSRRYNRYGLIKKQD